jgi:putative two-component system response regulator
VERFIAYEPDLILTDLHMPDMDGFEFLKFIRKNRKDSIFLPIVVLSGDESLESRKKALELGASDFLNKPGDPHEIILRVKNMLTMRIWNKSLSEVNRDLESRIRERTFELEQAQIEMIERLALAGEYRDDDTGQHAVRVGEIAADVAKVMGYPHEFVSAIGLAARLHDIGKLAIPDSVLLRPGKLTPEEANIMKSHCLKGARILSGSHAPLLRMAERIAASHHEWYDGTGYPHGLAGTKIPAEARIVAVADCYDALLQERPYRAAWPRKEALEEIKSLSGKQFDPDVVNAFLATVPVYANAS